MLSGFSQFAFWRFVLVVGFGAITIFDLWCLITRSLGVVILDWGVIGRWLIRLVTGKSCAGAPGLREKSVGWTFHYLLAFIYAMLLPLIWGPHYMIQPQLIPAILIGFCLTSLGGLTVLAPAMGCGFFARRSPVPRVVHGMVLAGHGIFAMALYGCAELLALTGFSSAL